MTCFHRIRYLYCRTHPQSSLQILQQPFSSILRTSAICPSCIQLRNVTSTMPFISTTSLFRRYCSIKCVFALWKGVACRIRPIIGGIPRAIRRTCNIGYIITTMIHTMIPKMRHRFYSRWTPGLLAVVVVVIVCGVAGVCSRRGKKVPCMRLMCC